MNSLDRYKRQISLDFLGEEGMRRLQNANVVVIGAGGLGSPVLTYLGCAGVGSIKIVDLDTVDITNLNRQFFYAEEELGQAKATLAAQRIKRQNPHIQVVDICTKLTAENVDNILSEATVVVDCVDNIDTRIIVNEYCVTHDIPFVEAGIDGMYGFVTAVRKSSPCLACMGFMDASVNKKEIPTLGVTAGIIGGLQANECLKIILGLEDVLWGKMLQYDGFKTAFEVIDFDLDEDCIVHWRVS